MNIYILIYFPGQKSFWTVYIEWCGWKIKCSPHLPQRICKYILVFESFLSAECSKLIWMTPLLAWGIHFFTAPEWTHPQNEGPLPNTSWMANFPFLTSLCVALTPSTSPPSTPSNSWQPCVPPPAINAKAWRGPLWGLEVIPGLFFFQKVGGWGDKCGEIWVEVGDEVNVGWSA